MIHQVTLHLTLFECQELILTLEKELRLLVLEIRLLRRESSRYKIVSERISFLNNNIAQIRKALPVFRSINEILDYLKQIYTTVEHDFTTSSIVCYTSVYSVIRITYTSHWETDGEVSYYILTKY